MSIALIKKAAELFGLSKPARYYTRRRPAILMYHGLSENPDCRDWTQVSLSDFTAQMRYLKSHYRPVSLDELVAMLESGSVAPHTVAVTFDDGYKSNYDLAFPVLKELGIPATIFVTSGFVLRHEKHRRYLWPDFISALLLSTAGDVLDLREFGLDQYDLTSKRITYSSRNVICEYLKSISSIEREKIISSLYTQYGENIDHGRFVDYLPMDTNDVRHLAESGLITVGAHSRTHPILSRLDSDRIEDEILGSKNDLEQMTGGAVTQFAYPNGRWEDINRKVFDITARNFECAVLTESGLNRSGQNKYLLRRIGIGPNLGFGQFRVLISGLYHLMQGIDRDHDLTRNG
jgi:peptidoglycan/xylan/chitin deacetylase (PgdA/CDA1 family)